MKSYLSSSILQLKYFKTFGEKTITRIPDNKLFFKLNDNSNSINTIVKHLNGNMLSRWTNFLNSDGEKDFRERDNEFVDDINNKEELLNLWSKGWDCLFNTLESLSEKDLEKLFISEMRVIQLLNLLIVNFVTIHIILDRLFT